MIKRLARLPPSLLGCMLKYLFLISVLILSSPTVLAGQKDSTKNTTITITRSLNYDGEKANISPKILKTIVRIFSWRIDFNKDLKKGDRFIIVGSNKSNPDAFIYITHNKRIGVFSHLDRQGRLGYYDINGKSLYPSFLRAPLQYDRISSRFQLNRFHPVLKVWRPHRAVDYAAKSGTPVYSVASGVVTHRKRMGPLGNVVFIKHGSNYVSVYAHLSRFARGLKVSSKVKTGQVIGYVGSTGRSTGPHLHYELRYKGIRKNPLTHPLPKQKKIPNNELRQFKKKANKILKNL